MKKVMGYSMYALGLLGGLVYFGFAMVWAYALGGPLAAVVAFFAAPVTIAVFLVVCLLSGTWALFALAAGSLLFGVVGEGLADGR